MCASSTIAKRLRLARKMVCPDMDVALVDLCRVLSWYIYLLHTPYSVHMCTLYLPIVLFQISTSAAVGSGSTVAEIVTW